LEFSKWLYSALGPTWFRIVIAVALSISIIFVILLGLLTRVLLKAAKAGRSAKVWLFEIGQQNTALATAPSAQTSEPQSSEIKQKQKIVYAKLIHCRDKTADRPVYKRSLPDGQEVDVYDEVVFFVFHSYQCIQPFGKWTVRSSGVAYPQVLYPWLDRLVYGDPRDPVCGPVVPVSCNEPSAIYIPLTHMFNGQQNGNRDVILRTESAIENARLVLDYSSIEGPYRITDLRAYRGDKQIPGVEVNKGVFTCEGTNLKVGEFMKICYAIEIA